MRIGVFPCACIITVKRSRDASLRTAAAAVASARHETRCLFALKLQTDGGPLSVGPLAVESYEMSQYLLHTICRRITYLHALYFGRNYQTCEPCDEVFFRGGVVNYREI